MRLVMLSPLLLLAACQVSKDETNDTITAEYNQDVAENVAADAANTAQNIGGAIVNEAEATGDKIQNEVGDVDVDVDVNRNAPANSN